MALNHLSASVIACGECGQLQQFQEVPARHTACCQRCKAVLYRNRPAMLDATLALTLTGLILFAISNFFPLLGLKAQGMSQELSLWKASIAFWAQGFQLLSILLIMNLIVLPLFELFTLFWVIVSIRFEKPNALAAFLYRWMIKLKPWGMLEVFMLGLLVAVVKLGDLAVLVIGPAFWSFTFLIVCMAAATTVMDPFVIWNRLTPDRETERL